jgi:transposase-like protein
LAIIFVFIGVLLILKARKIKKQAEKFRKYIDVTVYGGEKSIDNIAGAVGLQYEAVMKDLQHMIDSGYLKNTYINQANREILLKQVVQSHVQPINEQASKPIQSKAVRCPGCGANNIVSNSGICECEYCGTPLTV